MTGIRYAIFSIICTCFLSFNNANYYSFQYIQKYKDLAILEMDRTGIPASIKLAQGLLESQYGTSSLAQNAKNHFGIKCKDYWQGSTYYHFDDDRDQRGKTIKSCFRAYNYVMDSYIDHSNFLKETPHYSRLFSIPKSDYIGWAIGLKQCGYATDPMYSEKIIEKIEKFKLMEFDAINR